MDVCKCIVPARHGGTLNSRRAASPLVRFVEGEERWEASDHPQSVLPPNWSGIEPNRTVTCMMLKATANDRRHFAMINFVGLDLAFADQFTCRNCGGGDRGRVAIYRPFGEVSLSLNRTVTCMVLKANDRRTSCPCHDEFRGPRSDYVRQVALATTTTRTSPESLDYFV
ncbi:uncharacterized protein TNCV_1308201 [Trichonephila clavipes]|nr:uncharacterized protein TNCV_1308201 [Trichonephila clavipes]